MAVNIRAMARYTGMAESLDEGASANSIEGTCWHITKRVDMTVIVDANGIEWIWPSWMGVVEPSWCVIDVAREAGSGVTMG